MRHIGGLGTVLFLCLLSGSSSAPRSTQNSRSPQVQQLIDSGWRSFTDRHFDRALEQYRAALALTKPTDLYNRTSCLIGIANCLVGTRAYAEALAAYGEAWTLARAGRLEQHQVTIAANRAAVYKRLGNNEAAGQTVLQVEPGLLLRAPRPQLLANAGSIMQDFDYARSERLLTQAVSMATSTGDVHTATLALLSLGNGYLSRGDLPGADGVLTQAFRLRRLNKRSQMQPCYFLLGILRRRQGDIQSSVELLKRALETSTTPSPPVPLAAVHYELARSLQQARDSYGALEHYEAAVSEVRGLRSELLHSDVFRMGAETRLQEIFSAYVAAGMAEYERTGDVRLAARMLEVSEDGRAATFEASLLADRQLPVEYWQLLEQYQRALAASLDRGGATPSELTALRVALGEFEARIGVKATRPQNSHRISESRERGTALLGLRRKLKATDAILSFHTGAAGSFLWTVTRESFSARRLPPVAEIDSAVRGLREAITERRSSEAASARVSELVLRLVPAKVREKKNWILSLDGSLLELPFAALRSGSRNRFLVQDHTLRTVPGVLIQLPDSAVSQDRTFVGVADAIYNGADPRRERGSSEVPQEGLQLARLPGTAREIEVCSRAWGHDPRPLTLTGRAVNRQAVLDAARKAGSVLHIAAHVVPHPIVRDQVLIGLGIRDSGLGEFLSPADIVAGPRNAALVTLSGCASGTGLALPGLGVFGLTRAWLRAGARVVVASQWQIADDSGELLSSMYEVLGKDRAISSAAVAEALRAAQVRMIQSKGWRADPSYWAAFMVAGKD